MSATVAIYILAGQSNANVVRDVFPGVIAAAGGVAVIHARGNTTLSAIDPEPEA